MPRVRVLLDRFPCTFCTRIFTYRRSWLGHMTTVHPVHLVNTVTNLAPSTDSASSSEPRSESTVGTTTDDPSSIPSIALDELLSTNQDRTTTDANEASPSETPPGYAVMAEIAVPFSDCDNKVSAEELFAEVFGNDGTYLGEPVDDLDFSYFEEAPASPSPPDLNFQLFEADNMPNWLSDQCDAAEMLDAVRMLPISEVMFPSRLFREIQDRYFVPSAFLRALISSYHDVERSSALPEPELILRFRCFLPKSNLVRY